MCAAVFLHPGISEPPSCSASARTKNRKLSMSTAEEEAGTVKVQTRSSLTLTQDLDGNLILHCPQSETDEIDSEDIVGTTAKRLCLSSEHEHSFTETTPCISVVSLPLSTNDQSFEVTMTATTEVTDDDLNEDSVTQIQILQNEQLDDISTADSEEVAVSRAWFTSKEDKDSLTNKGHRWKQGMWSKEEIAILMNNIDQYLKTHGIKDATEIIFEMSKDERKDFYRTIAWGLNRPLFAVYRRVLRMYDDRNHVGKYTHAEIEKLRELRMKHGNDWATIGAALGRSASSVKDRCRLMKETCRTGKWTDDEERRLTEVVHELTGTETGDIVTQGVSWASVAERVGTRSEKQCRSKWLNYLNWKQSGGTQWTKEDEINLILRIAELGVLDENDINWDILSEGWTSVRSPQWLRSKWWTVKRQIANHKDVSFPVLIKGLRQLHEHHSTLLGTEELENKPDIQSQGSNGNVQHVQIRVAHLEDSPGLPQSSMSALQIPVQITHVSSSDSSSPTTDPETVTLNSGTLQTFEILPSFYLQPSGTTGTFILQTGSSQGLPITLTSNPSVTLTSNSSPASPEQIIVHALTPEHLLNTSDNVTVHCHTPGIIIRTVTSDEITSPLAQAQHSIDSDLQQDNLSNPHNALEANSFSQDIHHTDIDADQEALYCAEQSLKSRSRRSMKLMHHVEASDETCSGDLSSDNDNHIGLTSNYVKGGLRPVMLEEQVGQQISENGTLLIVPSSHSYIQTDDIDGESVLPLTTLADPILQHHGERPNLNDSSLDGPDSDDSKDVEDL
ncbi:cyclin-D-binding Myb-like transcription factor 1 [Pelobates cultripes]|uniref:Cyclin-D-binding Myb-like transcription factor 1 n=1 Tax=Pelobates cultripes TaxID=61616 RepID=A0AAD1RQK8_PELCU|nr:cyclin-D-binding Myb-like transcription factor 1 [Pelobates cultripes]